MPSVTQPWMENIPLRMQSVLLLGLRGPDTHRAPEIKKVVRWLRGQAFRPGNPDNVVEFMRSDPPPRILEKTEIAKELEFCSQHYYSHLMHALEVIGYCHPDKEVRSIGYTLFYDMCFLQHLPVESDSMFRARLGHMDWPGNAAPRDGKEAFELIEKYGRFSPRDKAFMKQEKVEGKKVEYMQAPSQIKLNKDNDDNY